VVLVFPNRNPNGELSIANKIKIKDINKNNTHSNGYLYQFYSSIVLHSLTMVLENSLDDPQV
jgi:hypothetical protein